MIRKRKPSDESVWRIFAFPFDQPLLGFDSAGVAIDGEKTRVLDEDPDLTLSLHDAIAIGPRTPAA